VGVNLKVFFFVYPRDSVVRNGTIVVFPTVPLSTSELQRFATIHDVAIQFATICDIFHVFYHDHRDSSRLVAKCRESSRSLNSWRFITNLFTTNRDESWHKLLKMSWIIVIQFTTSRILNVQIVRDFLFRKSLYNSDEMSKLTFRSIYFYFYFIFLYFIIYTIYK
jgi:hypothetical protein